MGKWIVIGGGILGASTAFHLAKSGEKVILIDRKDQGQATDAAMGMICPWLSQRRNRAWYLLAKNGAKYYPLLVEELSRIGLHNTGYEQVGAVSIQRDEEKLQKLLERAWTRREEAPEMGEIRLLTKEETKNMFPLLSDDYAGLYVSGAARVNGKALCEALVHGAKTRGAEIVKGSVEKIIVEGKQVKGVFVSGQRLEGDGVIVTAGAWAHQLFLPLGIHFNVTFQKGQIAHLYLAGQDTSKYPVVIPPNDQDILPFEGGKIVIGATHENISDFHTDVTAGGLLEILTKALEVAPGLSGATFVEARVGFRPFTPGFLPVAGQVPGIEGLFAANGLGASGLTVGPYLGCQLAKIAIGNPTDIDLSPYQLENAITAK